MKDPLQTAPVIGHDVAKGVERLLSAAGDLLESAEIGNNMSAARRDAHRALFDRYVAELTWAIELAIPWWNSMVRRRVANGDTEQESIRANYTFRPAGPASRPEVVWVIRTFWLECARLNASLPEDQRIPPQVVLLEWLNAPHYGSLVAVVSGMPYWPIGIDENGSFC